MTEPATESAATDGSNAPEITILPPHDPHVRREIFDLITKLVMVRKEHGYTQPNMAKMLGTHLNRIQALEGDMDASQIRLETVLRYARALGMKLKFTIKPFDGSPNDVEPHDEHDDA